jgi:hypothetical protein
MRTLLSTAALACVMLAVAPVAASARVVELGSGAAKADPVCPSTDQCAAPGRVTGYQGRLGNKQNPFYIRRSGYLVAFTVTLNDPAENQLAYFGDIYGSMAPQVRLAVLRRGDTRKTKRNTRLLRQSPIVNVRSYLGSSPTFVLRRPLRVNRGNIVGLTIPTWAPVFGKPQAGRNYWRASRPKNRCRDVRTDVQHTGQGRVETYGCDYYGVRLQYSATYVPDPRPTDQPERRRR